MERIYIKQGEDNYLEKLDSAVKSFNEGASEAPILLASGKANNENGVIKAVLTKELEDRDGEIMDIAGLDLSNYKNNPVLIDAHNMGGSIVTTALGMMTDIKKTQDEKGIKMITATVDFAPTPNGEIAKALFEGGYVRTFSIGFGVKDYDHTNRRIMKSELYETSAVLVPANVHAMVMKSFNITEAEVDDKLVKTIKNYKSIHPKIKEYRKLFLSKELSELLGYEITGNELIDIKNIYDLVLNRKTVETQSIPEQPKVETPQEAIQPTKKTITAKMLSQLVADAFEHYTSQN